VGVVIDQRTDGRAKGFTRTGGSKDNDGPVLNVVFDDRIQPSVPNDMWPSELDCLPEMEQKTVADHLSVSSFPPSAAVNHMKLPVKRDGGGWPIQTVKAI
jgi:hypothetical protein